jgi:hypothetical protein
MGIQPTKMARLARLASNVEEWGLDQPRDTRHARIYAQEVGRKRRI